MSKLKMFLVGLGVFLLIIFGVLIFLVIKGSSSVG